MASLRDYTVQEVLNKRHVRYSSDGQACNTAPAAANYLAASKAWSSLRCFNTGGDGTAGNAGGSYVTTNFGSADAAGNLGGGDLMFTTHLARTTSTFAYDVATIAFDGATSEFPSSGVLYAITYKDVDDAATADDTIPCIQKLTYTGRTGTTSGVFTGVTGWSAFPTIGDPAQEEGLQNNMVLSLYKDQNGTLAKGFPRAIEVTNGTARGIYAKFNDPQASTLVHIPGSSTVMFDEIAQVEDIFFGYDAAGTTDTTWTLWY
tara:strand:+ start:9015 stop:9797 length:783 start_codon:yes stop_codon:yes gene_type:complete